ncbi:DUF4349 domain-containing protein [Actinomadura sp. ATCC 31491]|uniref:DUF4349 domain-containing protein n=1 Tax=Actinomadura luzonensis TaxID=2805427 RepID=A0ABT0FYU0_9ACTN|nr:DUF4349 domain-containing protein [Actinomadura luzonensis]MCK2217480.1 DUF4349 domain-containing protein [Actinomadura luzonensis]
MRRLRYGITTSLALAALLLAGCGGGATYSESQAVAPAAQDAAGSPAAPLATPAPVPKNARSAQPAKAEQDGLASGVEVTRQDRQVIYTGSMSVRVKEVTDAVAQAKQIVTGAGGYLAREQSSSASKARETATLEFKIPPAAYPAVLGRLGKELGTQISLEQSTQDVTLQVADVNSRLKSAQQSLESLRTLLKRADTIGQVLEVEREIASREADLESLQAQQKELATQVAMATLTLRLLGPVAAAPEPEEDNGFVAGLKSGWKALLTSLVALLTFLGAVLPWAVAALPLVVLFVYLTRRSRARRAAPPSSPSSPSSPSPPRPGEPGPEAAA